VTRLADFVKNSPVTSDGQPAGNDLTISKYFSNANFGRLDEPCVIVDRHGHVIVWHFPGILTKARVVRQMISAFNDLKWFTFHRMTPTKRWYIWKTFWLHL
jgi:hypothetical protein